MIVLPVLAAPAGVIPYSCITGEPYVLLAFDPAPGRRGYGAFGGSKRFGETVAETAAREFREETRCVFEKPDANDLAATTPSLSHGYYSFVAEVPYVSPMEIVDHPCEARMERFDWQWIRLSDLMVALDKPEARPKVLVSLIHEYVKLWDKSAESLRDARKDGLLNPEKLCL